MQEQAAAALQKPAAGVQQEEGEHAYSEPDVEHPRKAQIQVQPGTLGYELALQCFTPRQFQRLCNLGRQKWPAWDAVRRGLVPSSQA